MIPTNKEVRNILENARKHTEEDKWIEHCICVGNTGAKIAEALGEKGYNVDPEKTRILGYVHDIGKMIELPYRHEINGYNYMKEQGYDEEYCNICITHSYLNNDINCVAGGVKNPEEEPFISEFVKKHKYSIEEKIINLCDLMCPPGGKVYTIDKRLIDLILRKAVIQIFSGIIAPISLFPIWFQKISEFLPFKELIYTPINIWLGQVSFQEIVFIIIKQIIWGFILYIIAKKFFNHAVKNITINGG